MRFLRRSLTGLFLLSLTVGFLAWAGWMLYSAVETRMADDGAGRAARERVFAVNVLPYVAEDITPVLATFGEVRSRRALDIRATVSGTVVELSDSFVDGGEVETGAVLMRIDPAEAESDLARAEADLAEAEAELRDAERALVLAGEELSTTEEQARLRRAALTRQRDLRERGVGTEATVEAAELAASAADQAVVSRRQALAQAEARVDLARNRLARQKINLADAERKLADTTITAEFSGTLGDVSVVEGGLVANNERVGQLTDPNRLEVSFRVSTSQYARLLDQDGQLTRAPVRVTMDVSGIDLSTDGVISRESASVGEGQTGRLLFARLAEARGFRPGDFVTVRIREPMLNAVARLPATAVDSASRVLVLGEEDRLEEAEVTLLRRQDDDVLIRAPELAGREVIAARSPLLGAGIKVRPIRENDASAAEQPDTVELTDERRAALMAFVEGNTRMPDDAKARVLAQLAQDKVPAQVVKRLEARMGG